MGAITVPEELTEYYLNVNHQKNYLFVNKDWLKLFNGIRAEINNKKEIGKRKQSTYVGILPLKNIDSIFIRHELIES